MKLQVETFLMEIILVLKVTMNQVKTKKTLFWLFLQIREPYFNPQTLKCIYLYIFKHCLVFAIFKTVPARFES